jgi:hypothetical protein
MKGGAETWLLRRQEPPLMLYSAVAVQRMKKFKCRGANSERRESRAVTSLHVRRRSLHREPEFSIN